MWYFVKSIAEGAKAGGIRKALQVVKEEGLWNCITDGALWKAKLWADKNAVLVGVDQFGNKYYEKKSAQSGRSRWVEYGDKRYYNASSVPPEWHGWLHYVTDHTAEQLEDLKPKRYGIAHRPNRTGEGEEYIYHAKGHALSPNQRDWTRYAAWKMEDPPSDPASAFPAGGSRR